MAKREVIDILKKYVVLLKSEGIAVEKAFLYGSYSLDSETDDSDIDLMIVTNDAHRRTQTKAVGWGFYEAHFIYNFRCWSAQSRKYRLIRFW